MRKKNSDGMIAISTTLDKQGASGVQQRRKNHMFRDWMTNHASCGWPFGTIAGSSSN